MPSYEPKGADVWSLGIVLLNLLFHRCPWADPTLDDPDFCAFRRDPVHFLETRFEGIGNEVATFLANRVFCDVEDVDLSPESVDAPLPSSVATATPLSMRRSMPRNVRVTAGEFAKWASKLVRYMGEGSRRASISESTRQMMHTVRQSPRIDAGRAFHSPPARSPRNSLELQRPVLDGSPSRKNKRLSVGLPNDLLEELEKAEGDGNQTLHDLSGLKSAPEHPSPLTQSLLEQIDQVDSSEVVKQLSESNREIRKQSAAAEGGDGQEEPASPNEGESSTKDKHRRRKRGARKGKGHHREKGDGVESSRSRKVDGDAELPDNEAGDQLEPESPNLDIVDTSKTLQAYAREISQTTKPPLVTSPSYTPGLVSENAISHRLRVGNSVGSPPQSATEVRQAPTSKSRFADKLKNAFANGNPELQAFAARAKERDLALSGVGERNPTASAPAKMQHSTGSYQHPSSQISSFGSVASSTGSWSEDGGAGKHWASTSSRRNRVDRIKKPSEDFTLVGSAGTAPAASNRVGRAGPSARHQYATRDQASTTGSSPSPSRRSFTPLSSFSSATSYDARSVGGNPSPSGIAVSGRTARSPLQSIDETSSGASLKDRGSTDDEHSQAATPLAGSTVLEPLHRQELRSQAATVPHILREPRLPPMENQPLPTQEKATSVLVTEAPAEVPPVATSASRAKIGKFFNKFSRG